MSNQTERLFSAFKNRQRVTLGSMTGKDFGRLMNELREMRERQAVA